jgi:hypothetical protein
MAFLLEIFGFVTTTAEGNAAKIRMTGRETLRGLTQVHVLIENLDDDELKAGLTKDQIKVDTELRLRKARIKVVDDDQSYLSVRVTAIADAETGRWSFAVAVTMNQLAELTRTRRPFTADTWGTGGLWTADNSQFLLAVRQAVGDSVDKFINDYLAANQK